MRPGSPWPAETRNAGGRLLILTVLAFSGTAWAFRDAPASVWMRVTGVMAALGAVCAAATRRDLRTLFRLDRVGLAAGPISGLVLYAAAWIFLRWEPAAAQARELYAVRAVWPRATLLATLPVIAAGEELIWRAAITRLLADRLPLWAAVSAGAALYGAAHAASGTWFLPLAATGAGLAWGLLFVATRSLVGPLLSHLTFDVLTLILAPLT